jgi:hypothetical protein
MSWAGSDELLLSTSLAGFLDSEILSLAVSSSILFPFPCFRF